MLTSHMLPEVAASSMASKLLSEPILCVGLVVRASVNSFARQVKLCTEAHTTRPRRSLAMQKLCSLEVVAAQGTAVSSCKGR